MSKQHDNATNVVRAINASVTGCLTVGTLADVLNIPRTQADSAIAFLAGRKLIENCSRGCWRLTDAGKTTVVPGVLKNKTGVATTATKQQTAGADGVRLVAWRALRIAPKLTMDELLGRIDDGSEQNVRTRIGRYLNGLVAAEVLMRKGKHFILAKDLGPVAPTVGKANVFDPNKGVFLLGGP